MGTMTDEYEQEEYTYVVRNIMLSPKCGNETRRHKHFHTRCTVQGSLCDLIIDSGSQENIISKYVMEKLQLETETHPKPYVIWWIKEVDGIMVNERCKVSFIIGKYNDKVYCDVVCHAPKPALKA